MATQTGILQALWGEVRPAVEARDPAAAKPLSRLVSRGKCPEALAAWTEILARPAQSEGEVLLRLAGRLTPGGSPLPADGPPAALKERVWALAEAGAVPSLLNCRLFLDDPRPDRVWLHRHGAWILYRWDGRRFLGTPLPRVRREAGTSAERRTDCLLDLSVNGRIRPNPKLPPE